MLFNQNDVMIWASSFVVEGITYPGGQGGRNDYLGQI